MKTPEQIATAKLAPLGIDDDGTVTTVNTSLLYAWIEQAVVEARSDIAVASHATLVVSTRDGKARTGVTNNTLDDLMTVVVGYLANGYYLKDLVIEGVTE